MGSSARRERVTDSRYRVVIACVISMTVFVGWLIGANHPEWWGDHGLIYRFQTLIGAGMAIIAALIGGGAVYHQTASNRERERRLDGVREIAARAALPHLLSEIVDYCEASITTLNDMRRAANDQIIPKGTSFAPTPTLKPEIVDGLKEAALEVGASAREAIARLLLALQVQKARLLSAAQALTAEEDSFRSSLLLVSNVDTYAVDTAAVFARLEKLYPYSRLKADSASARLTKAEVISALSKLNFLGEWQDFTYHGVFDERGEEEYTF